MGSSSTHSVSVSVLHLGHNHINSVWQLGFLPGQDELDQSLVFVSSAAERGTSPCLKSSWLVPNWLRTCSNIVLGLEDVVP